MGSPICATALQGETKIILIPEDKNGRASAFTSLSPELLLPMSVKQTVSVAANIAVSFQKVLDQFFPHKITGVLIF